MSTIVNIQFLGGREAPHRPRPVVDLFGHPHMAPFAKSLTADQRAQATALIRDASVEGWTVGQLQTRLASALARPRKAMAAMARTGLSVAAHA